MLKQANGATIKKDLPEVLLWERQAPNQLQRINVVDLHNKSLGITEYIITMMLSTKLLRFLLII